MDESFDKMFINLNLGSENEPRRNYPRTCRFKGNYLDIKLRESKRDHVKSNKFKKNCLRKSDKILSDSDTKFKRNYLRGLRRDRYQ